jgi:anti-anti-sigma factor
VADHLSSPPLAPFDVRVRHLGTTALVVVAGELDILTAPRLERVVDDVIEHGVGRLVLDLRDVEFLGSSGIAIVERLLERARADGFSTAVVRGRSGVQRVLEIAGLTDRIPFVDSPDDLS